eukprot:gnl/MRDRNA2_/MRDRNA2_121964_c0_seq1.p1 gnl/MRDRNA2_/MRDRNA2_121964_c0~~gnl/MRDRNA2_/MRDRNA2_121964_c0_seq1.p1  ORF type:complete len:519 (-),score=121.61 gnl/MRDRNA2_/MRDRNA2_121964_c0_seq1:16-1530(-)
MESLRSQAYSSAFTGGETWSDSRGIRARSPLADCLVARPGGRLKRCRSPTQSMLSSPSQEDSEVADASRFQVVNKEHEKLPSDPHDPRLMLKGAICYRDGRLLLDAYSDLRYKFRAEPPAEEHPDPRRPGMQLWEDTDALLQDVEVWNDGHCCVANRHGDLKRAAGWIAHHPIEVTPSGDRVSKCFSTQTWGSWRLAFLLAKLQRDVWWDRYGKPTSTTMKVTPGASPCTSSVKKDECEAKTGTPCTSPHRAHQGSTNELLPDSHPHLRTQSKVEENKTASGQVLDASMCSKVEKSKDVRKFSALDEAVRTKPFSCSGSLVVHADKMVLQSQTKLERVTIDVKRENNLSPGPVTLAIQAIAQSSPAKVVKLEVNPLLASIFGNIKQEQEQHPSTTMASAADEHPDTTVVTPPRKSMKFDKDDQVGEASPSICDTVNAKRRRIVGKREICSLLMGPNGACHMGWLVKQEELKIQGEACKTEPEEGREGGLFAFIRRARALAWMLD